MELLDPAHFMTFMPELRYDLNRRKLSMPLFTVHCEACSEESEVLVRGEQKLACPACGSTTVTKLLPHFAAVSASPEPMGCGAGNCCMMGGGCAN